MKKQLDFLFNEHKKPSISLVYGKEAELVDFIKILLCQSFQKMSEIQFISISEKELASSMLSPSLFSPRTVLVLENAGADALKLVASKPKNDTYIFFATGLRANSKLLTTFLDHPDYYCVEITKLDRMFIEQTTQFVLDGYSYTKPLIDFISTQISSISELSFLLNSITQWFLPDVLIDVEKVKKLWIPTEESLWTIIDGLLSGSPRVIHTTFQNHSNILTAEGISLTRAMLKKLFDFMNRHIPSEGKQFLYPPSQKLKELLAKWPPYKILKAMTALDELEVQLKVNPERVTIEAFERVLLQLVKL